MLDESGIPGGHFDDFGDRIEEGAGGEDRDEKEDVGVKLLRRGSVAACDVFRGGETARFVPARGDKQADGESGCGHRELYGDGDEAHRVGDRPPYHERSGREEAHEQRQPADPPRDVAASGEKTLHVFAGRGEQRTDEHDARRKDGDGYVVQNFHSSGCSLRTKIRIYPEDIPHDRRIKSSGTISGTIAIAGSGCAELPDAGGGRGFGSAGGAIAPNRIIAIFAGRPDVSGGLRRRIALINIYGKHHRSRRRKRRDRR